VRAYPCHGLALTVSFGALGLLVTQCLFELADARLGPLRVRRVLLCLLLRG
jgi:hypothetical protein